MVSGSEMVTSGGGAHVGIGVYETKSCIGSITGCYYESRSGPYKRPLNLKP